jgi:ABC-2 type transport system ATP-binding protein
MTSDIAVEATDLVKHFGDTIAVDGVSFAIPRGTVLSMLGPNGAGKTTTVRMLTTLSVPTSGTGKVNGHDIITDPHGVRRSMGLTGQAATVDELLTGRENIRLIGRLYGIPRKRIGVLADELLERFSLSDAADRIAKTYSGGMRRRLDLAVSLVAAPTVLFLDEPTTGLDPQSRSALWDEVQRLASDSGVTVFLTTQYLEEADVLADRIGIIHQGRIVAEGTPEALKAEISRPTLEIIPADHGELARTRDVLARFGEPANSSPKGAAVRLSQGEAQLADVVRALDAEDIHVHHLQLHAPTLDDVFLEKTGRSLEGAAEEEQAAEPDAEEVVAA